MTAKAKSYQILKTFKAQNCFYLKKNCLQNGERFGKLPKL